jgi:L-iditol 2-dehydrogenase
MKAAELTLVRQRGTDTQKVAILNGPGDISIGHAEIPQPGEGEIRIRIKWVGICGSDLEAFRGTRRAEFLSTPTRLGHEVAGVIDKIGPNVHGLEVGAKVVCRYVWGAFAQYIVCKPFNVKVLPKKFPMEDISLMEILPGVLHAAELARITPSTKVLITGQGVSGLMLTQVFHLHSPAVLAVTDLKTRNLELARKYGATHAYQVPTPDTPTRDVLGKDFPSGFDVVVPCLLEGDGMVDAIECTALCGRIVMYGCIGLCRRPIDFYTVHRKRLDILSTEPKRDIDMRRLLAEGVHLALDGLVNTREMVTHKVPLSQIDKAFAIRNNKLADAIHVLVDCDI